MTAERQTSHNEEAAARHGWALDSLRVRSAEPQDADPIAAILADAFPALYHATFGTRDKSAVRSLLTALYAAGHLSLVDTRVCDVEGRVAGVIILHTGKQIGRGSPREYWSVVRRELGLLRAPRAFGGGVLANVMLGRRIPRAPDLVYIEALAVAEPHRGQGIGSRLLANADEWATARGRIRLALHVLVSNVRARRLYERVGFRTWHSPPHNASASSLLRASAWSAILMERRLDNRD